MFDQYFQLGQRLKKHYLSPRVIFCLATGRFIPPIHRRNLYSLQYSMLPLRRVGIAEVWSRLTEKSPRGVGLGKGAARGAVYRAINSSHMLDRKRGHRS